MAVNGRQQQIVSRGRTGAGFPPEGLQQSEDAGLLGGQPEGSGQTQFAAGGGEGKRRGALVVRQNVTVAGLAQRVAPTLEDAYPQALARV